MKVQHLSYCLLCCLLLVGSWVACDVKKNDSSSEGSPHQFSNKSELETSDSTICGVLVDNYGMNTLSLRTEQGDTLEFLRHDVEGVEAEIWGDLHVGHRLAVLTTDGGESLKRVFNLSMIELYVRDYAIHRGHLVLHMPERTDTVMLQHLSQDSLVAVGKRKTYRFYN